MKLTTDVRRGYVVRGILRSVHHKGTDCGSKRHVLVTDDWRKVTCRRCLARRRCVAEKRWRAGDDALPPGVRYEARRWR